MDRSRLRNKYPSRENFVNMKKMKNVEKGFNN